MNRIIIDTREKFEYKMGHYKGAINIPPAAFMQNTLPEQLLATPKDTEIVLYCRSGARSNTVGHILRGQGFINIVNRINQNHVARLVGA